MQTVSLTIDIEMDWGRRLKCQLGNCNGIEKGIPVILDLLDRYGIKATFFISGEIIHAYRDIITEIHLNGNEISSHGYLHNIDYATLSPNELEHQIRTSKDKLESMINTPVIGFRTPQFRVSDVLFDVLRKSGMIYDSSIVRGMLPGRYANFNIQKEPFKAKNGIREFPITTMPFIRIPMGLLWINAIGCRLFNLHYFFTRFGYPNHCTIYFHPFDVLKEKGQSDYGFVIERWYNLKSSQVVETLEKLIDFFVEKRRFLMLKELVAAETSQTEIEH